MLAPAVVDAVEQVDVALYAPQLLFRLARRVDKLGLVGAEAVNEPLPVVLAVVQLHEMDDSLNDFRSQGIGIAAPGFQQDGERFLIKLRSGAPELRKGGVDAEDATRRLHRAQSPHAAPLPRWRHRTRLTTYPLRKDWRGAWRWG